MQNKNISNLLDELSYTNQIQTLIEQNQKEICVKFLTGSLRPLTISTLWNKQNKKILIFAQSDKEAEDWYQDLQLFVPASQISLLTKPKSSVQFEIEKLDEQLLWLIEGLSTIQNNQNSIIITTPKILDVQLPSKDTIEKSGIKLTIGQNVNFEEFTQTLALNGFDRKEFVSTTGDIAIRGGIVDIFPVGSENPLRIEFFGDEIESIRSFNPLSQRSIRSFENIEFIGSILHQDNIKEFSTIFNYLSDDCLIVLDSPEALIAEYNEFDIPDIYKIISINKLGKTDIIVNSVPQPNFKKSIQNLVAEVIKMIDDDFKIILAAEGKIHLDRFRELFENSLELPDEQILPADDNNNYITDRINKALQSITWLDKTITNGFILPDEHVAFITEHQVFERLHIQSERTSKRNKGGITLQELSHLNIGDFVVHADKGIGKFDGFKTVKLGDSIQDCVRLTFAEDDILYVHLNYIHKLQKYSSQEGVQPKLSKLGSAEWLRKKSRTKKRLKDIARDLIQLYAKRKMQTGFSFPEDSIWQKEFEASFIYEDTPDQAQTTSEVKLDMSNISPMDRLVCGDVGYGKTEIAIRAAFKAVQAGKQVAVLVPTTILAQQHYLTFTDRLMNYPVNIDVISRFRTKKEQTQILEKLKEAKIDILIGTHRLLSSDIVFKDIGLLIIDEEHRFGVGAKEKLRQLKTTVDTLTLTATPIPRTLNFSLMGARDISVIETAPRNRLPITTEILEWNDNIIKKAVSAEIERKGQVFFVSDKVKDLEKLKLDLQMRMPSIRFGIAHGQMTSTELEKVMEKFIEQKYDVLVTTKIIESGLDIPRANTIIINNSQNFGLAELYQLRGRVGRSNQQAYCYLLIPPVKHLSSNSLKRLQAIEEFTDLGSGFQLAMRDMEIRGAGNLLGAEQSGFINEIGFDLYHKILDEAVAELRTEEFADLFKDANLPRKPLFENEDIAIELNTNALLPSDYIKSDTERFYFYKKLYNIRENNELQNTVEELEDRFGKLPDEVTELIFAVRLRILAITTGLIRIAFNKNNLLLEFPPESNTQFYETAFQSILEYIQELPGSRLIQEKKKLFYEIRLSKRDDAVEILWRIKKIVENLS